MKHLHLFLGTALLGLSLSQGSQAVERGLTGAIGISDIRAGDLPPPGLYGAASFVYVGNKMFFDRQNEPVAFLDGLRSTTRIGVATLLYVPKLKVFDGSIGLTAILGAGEVCGKILTGTKKRCIRGLRDPYIELAWSRFWGKIRFSEYAGAPPIKEGLSLKLGGSVIVPIGRYDVDLARSHGQTVGRNIWAFSPQAALTYTTPPILAEGTEFSTKFTFNTFPENSETHYKTGDLVNIDFAVTERIGRFQVGMAGNYYAQTEGDREFGILVQPGGRPAEDLSFGAVGLYSMPETKSAIKIRAMTSVYRNNLPRASSLSIGFIKKLY